MADQTSPAVWIEPAMGGYRLCGTGRVAGTTWRSAHLCSTRGEARAALRAADSAAYVAHMLTPGGGSDG